MRDLADVGGEGRMFKQQQKLMNIDDEEEVAEEEQTLIDFVPPKPVDFSDVDPEERKRNFVQFGGGQVDDTELKDSDAINAIIWAGYPGQSGGEALANIITGKVAPAARLRCDII